MRDVCSDDEESARGDTPSRGANAIDVVASVAVAAYEAVDANSALLGALEEVCRGQGWPAGRVWQREHTGVRALVLSGVAWPTPADASVVPSRAAGEAAQHRQVRVTRDADAKNGAVGCPVIVGGDVEMVLEFDCNGDTTPDAAMCTALEHACTLLARRLGGDGTTHRIGAEVGGHDLLTGLSTWPLFLEQVQRALALAGRTEWSIAVLCVDLDSFHRINDELGHEAGDEILATVAQRLRASLRQLDTLARASVTRVGADEFLVLCERVGGEAGALVVASRLLNAVAEPVVVGDRDAPVTASIGLAVGTGGTVAGQLVQAAEAAQRRAKQIGGNCIQVFTAGAHQAEAAGSVLTDDIRRGLSAEEFKVVYQPKISLETDRIVGVEALVRWSDPERGLLMPGEFIAAAERSGLIVPLGAHVLRTAARQAALWRSAFPRTPLTVAVNVSARQFRTDLPHVVRSALSDAGADPTMITLEMTETTIMQDIAETIDILAELKSLGVTLSVDDFGTGYSSLEYLHRMPIDEIKIDRSFVAGLGTDDVSSAIVASVISLAHAMELDVVAEGVETSEQLMRLRSVGCDFAQGYLIAHPNSVADIDEHLAADTAGEKMALADPTGGTLRPLLVETVLVVDDTADVRMLARMSLTAVGFVVEEAGNGAAAIALARRLRPDCVLLDVSMPDMNGFEVCRTLRADPATAACTVVMVSTHDTATDKAEAFLAGADDYIVKPFAPRDLVTRVRAASRRRRAAVGSVGEQVDSVLLEMLRAARETEVAGDVLADATQLSVRQLEILKRLLGGERVPGIARDLYLSQSTVRNHLSTIYQRLGVHSQEELLTMMRKKAADLSPPS